MILNRRLLLRVVRTMRLAALGICAAAATTANTALAQDAGPDAAAAESAAPLVGPTEGREQPGPRAPQSTQSVPPTDTDVAGDAASDPTAPSRAPNTRRPSEPTTRRTGPTIAPSEARPDGGAPPIATKDQDSLRYTLDHIEVRGNAKTHSRVVLRYVPFRPGDLLDVDDPRVELTRYRLLGTGFFRDVQFSLKKGSRPGYVSLVIDVVERNTVVVNDLWLGLGADADNDGRPRALTAYAGVDVAETNLAGTGITLGTALGLARDQLALRLRFLDPAFLGGPWMTSGSLLYNDARDFFGNRSVNYIDQTPSNLPFLPDFAIVSYKRFGGSLGVGRDVSLSTQIWARYRLESINADIPSAASHIRGMEGELGTEPIDFRILPGRSVLSTLSVTLQHDTRDKPFLSTKGWFVSATTELGLAALGSEYGYTRTDLLAAKWFSLPLQHVLRLEFFGGLISGNAPFFEQYYVGDLSDFRASRVLGLNVERRPPPNFLKTAIGEVRFGDYAAKLTGEYRVPLYRGTRSVYGIDIFASFGVIGIARERDLTNPPLGYSRAARIPVDLTGNLGFQMDTSAGGFTLAFANVLGFAPVIGGD